MLQPAEAEVGLLGVLQPVVAGGPWQAAIALEVGGAAASGHGLQPGGALARRHQGRHPKKIRDFLGIFPKGGVISIHKTFAN